jgi:hypothetical protein
MVYGGKSPVESTGLLLFQETLLHRRAVNPRFPQDVFHWTPPGQNRLDDVHSWSSEHAELDFVEAVATTILFYGI